MPDTRSPRNGYPFDDEEFQYDPVGNRLARRTPTKEERLHKYDVANRLLEDDEFTYQWDLSGNMIGKTAKSGSERWAYTYDAENMMTRAEKFSPSSAQSSVLIAQYSYDPLGRRILKSVATAQGPTPTAEFFLYDNEDIVAECDADTRAQTRTYLHGPGIDEPLAQVSGNTIEFFHSDALGSITNVSDPSAALTASARYSSFGLLSASGSFVSRYSYTAREGPEEPDLYYFRFRYYGPAAGRFTSNDPAGFEPGLDKYLYVENNPIIFFDPWGLQTLPSQLPGSQGPSYGQRKASHGQCRIVCYLATTALSVTAGLGAGLAARVGFGGASAASKKFVCQPLCGPPPVPPPQKFCRG